MKKIIILLLSLLYLQSVQSMEQQKEPFNNLQRLFSQPIKSARKKPLIELRFPKESDAEQIYKNIWAKNVSLISNAPFNGSITHQWPEPTVELTQIMLETLITSSSKNELFLVIIVNEEIKGLIGLFLGNSQSNPEFFITLNKNSWKNAAPQATELFLSCMFDNDILTEISIPINKSMMILDKNSYKTKITDLLNKIATPLKN